MHRVPAKIWHALVMPTSTASASGRRRTFNDLESRHCSLLHCEHDFALWPADVIVDDIRWTEHDGRAKISTCFERSIDSGDERIDSHRRRFAPMEVPGIDDNDADAPRIDGLFADPWLSVVVA